MFIHVRLICAFDRILTYRVPADWPNPLPVHALVLVPLQKRTVAALVISSSDMLTEQERTFRIRDALAYSKSILDEHFRAFIQATADYYVLDERVLYRRLIQSVTQKSSPVELVSLGQGPPTLDGTIQTSGLPPKLTNEQQAVVDHVCTPPVLPTEHPQPVLLHGVTGSGKTEVYAAIMAHALKEHRSVLFLIPEVTLAVRFVALFKQRFGTAMVHGYHSGSSAAEKKGLWHQVHTKQPGIFVGVHLPVFVPIPSLGYIIVDEEHECGYQEKHHPHFNSRDISLLRAHHARLPILLGSATPSIHALHMVETGRWNRFRLTTRFFCGAGPTGALPHVRTVSLVDHDKKRRPCFWLSHELVHAIEERLARSEQTILFLNRRGHSFFVQCRDCGHIVTCDHCSVSMTVHRLETTELVCHYCRAHRPYPRACPQCASKNLQDHGIGTQQIVTAVQKQFPTARVERADLDSTVQRTRWQATIDRMNRGEIDVLVGTQTITKGYHFPRLSLVGVIWADSSLSFPFYNAAEVGLQQLIQVAGRAGREGLRGEVLVQTIVEHPVHQFLSEDAYENFYAYEKQYRARYAYPPYIRFAELEFRHEQEAVAKQDAYTCAAFIRSEFPSVTVLGPADPPVKKIKNVHIQKIFLKADRFSLLQELYRRYRVIMRTDTQVFFTPSPLS